MDSSDFEKFIDRLSERLSQPLPGIAAQRRMAPRPINERRFSPDPDRPTRSGGVMVLLYFDDGHIRLPLIKRPVYSGAHSGQVSFPGGKVEKGDVDLTATAVRETKEEIGVSESHIKVLGDLSELFIVASNFKISPTVGVLTTLPKFVPDRREVVQILNPSLADLTNKDKQGVQTMKFPPFTIQSPYFDVEGEIVWGATAMVISELLQVVEEVR